MKNKEIKILLSAPRGFCAGVERAIEIVKKSIQKYGSIRVQEGFVLKNVVPRRSTKVHEENDKHFLR